MSCPMGLCCSSLYRGGRLGGHTACLLQHRLQRGRTLSWETIAVNDALRPPSPQPAPPPACPLSLLKPGGFIAPGGAFNHFPVSCKAGALQIAWLPLPLWVQHPHSPSRGRLREVAASAGQSCWRQSKRRYSVCSRC